MKRNLQLALALTLGLATTVSAQDWSVDSRTRVNNHDIAGATSMNTEQFARMGVSFGGDAVSVNASFNAHANLGSDAAASFGVHEAYASTDLMGWASVSAGRMALNLGSGRIIGSNDWNNNGNTWDGFMFGINNDFADLSVGYASANYANTADASMDFDATQMIINAAKDMGDMSFNLTYVSTDNSGAESTAMGLDGTYAMANGADVSFGYYTAEDAAGTTMGLTSVGVSYGVSDDLTVNAGYDMYDENGFYLASGNVADFAGTGMTAITSECTDMTFGGSYNMGDMTFGATMHNVSNDLEGDAAIDYSVTDINFGYTLSDNSSLGLTYSKGEEDTRMWLSLNVGF